MKRLGKIEIEVLRQAWRDHSGRYPLDRASVLVNLYGWRDLGSRHTIQRFDPAEIGLREYRNGQNTVSQAIRSLKRAGYLELDDGGELRLTEEGLRVAASLWRPRHRGSRQDAGTS